MMEIKGLFFKQTCAACPEQYDVFKDGEQVGYVRLRDSELRVDVPDCGDLTIMYNDLPWDDTDASGGEFSSDAAREVVKMSGKRSLVYGVGVNDWGSSIKVNGRNLQEYDLWHCMLRRCFDEKRKQEYPTYKDVACSKEWLSMTTFIEDVSQMRGYGLSGWHLDKDILQKGNKLYSKGTCCFVPAEINSLLTKSDNSRGEHPVGVSFHKASGKFAAKLAINGKQKHLGLFNTAIEAFQAYKAAKEAQIKVVAQKWKHLLDEWVFQALMVYEVAIDD